MTIITTALIIAGTTLATTAYGSRQAKKRANKQAKEAQEQRYIEGAAPMLPGVGEIDAVAEAIGGSELQDLVKKMDYGAGDVDFSSILEENPEAMAQLQEQLPGLLEAGEQGLMQMASGGVVGSPKDVYYFSVPNIQQMMGDPNAGIQAVGNEMMGQLQANPGQGMVQATPGQIQQMAGGGRIRRYNNGGFLGEGDPLQESVEMYKQQRLAVEASLAQARDEEERELILSNFRNATENFDDEIILLGNKQLEAETPLGGNAPVKKY